MTQATTEKDVYLASFETFEKVRSGDDPSWLQAVRREAIAAFGSLGFPTVRQEAWRFTNVAPVAKIPFRVSPPPSALDAPRLNGARKATLGHPALRDLEGPRLVFIDGHFSHDLSRLDALPEGIEAGSLARAIEAQDPALEEHLSRHVAYAEHPFAALNTAFLSDGAYIRIPAGRVFETPLQVVYLPASSPESGTGEALVSYPRTLILAGRSSEATIVETYLGVEDQVYLTNAVTEVVLEENAVLHHTKIEAESARAFHIASGATYQAKASQYDSANFTLGGALVRNDFGVLLDGEGCDGILNGLYVTRGSQLVDNHTRIEHAKPHCTSHELYKGILDDTSNAVFNGRIFVEKDAQKTDAKQSNKNLLLSKSATVNTNPELEIFADDVRCTHGATIGNLDDEQLFYLRARGIDVDTARDLLTYGFASEVIGLVRNGAVRGVLDKLFFPELPQGERFH